MHRFFFIILLVAMVSCTNEPKPEYTPISFDGSARYNRIYDMENILSDTDSTALNQLYLAHERKTSNQIVFLSTPSSGRDSLGLYTANFCDSLGVGRGSLNNGLGISLSVAQRGSFIATGRDTELVMSDSVCARIVDQEIIPMAKQERYYDGIYNASLVVIEYLERPENRMDSISGTRSF